MACQKSHFDLQGAFELVLNLVSRSPWTLQEMAANWNQQKAPDAHLEQGRIEDENLYALQTAGDGPV